MPISKSHRRDTVAVPLMTIYYHYSSADSLWSLQYRIISAQHGKYDHWKLTRRLAGKKVACVTGGGFARVTRRIARCIGAHDIPEPW